MLSEVSIFHVFGGNHDVCRDDWVLAKVLHLVVSSHSSLTFKLRNLTHFRSSVCFLGYGLR